MVSAKEKQLTIKLLTEKIERISGKKVILKEEVENKEVKKFIKLMKHGISIAEQILAGKEASEEFPFDLPSLAQDIEESCIRFY